jgi:YHS domain-containing protein
MNSKQYNMMLLLATLSLVGLLLVGGCKKSEPEGPTEVETATAVAGEQTICPIMGMAIDKDIFVEYKGKKVYFCCADCKDKFNAEPEKYLAKLPQFK